MNLTCNSTLEDMRIGSSEIPVAGTLTFHNLAMIISGSCTLIAILVSFYMIIQHARNYTQPAEQKHIIRILFMVPVYAASAFLSLWYYWHAVYFQVISDCYEAFAISSFFALMCAFIAPDLHDQKEWFRRMEPVKGWVLPVNWFAKCCGGERGPWRTPRSGLTWFNIIWISIYQYCFIRVAMTITAVVTQYFDRYCESSNSPVFAHIWITAIECVAVTIAMYCVIQFYIQLKEPLHPYSPFLKVLAIKLVIFLSFWQSMVISVATSSLNIVHANDVLSYPDLKVGIPSLLLCFEMAVFAVLHIWAFSYKPYKPSVPDLYYPSPSETLDITPVLNKHAPEPLGFFKALWDAINLWDVVKSFGRGIRWLFCGVKKRHQDAVYEGKRLSKGDTSYDSGYPMEAYSGGGMGGINSASLPIATSMRHSRYEAGAGDESAGLINNAQPEPYESSRPRPQYSDNTVGNSAQRYQPYEDRETGDLGSQSANPSFRVVAPRGDEAVLSEDDPRRNPRNSTQIKVGQALWGDGYNPGSSK